MPIKVIMVDFQNKGLDKKVFVVRDKAPFFHRGPRLQPIGKSGPGAAIATAYTPYLRKLLLTNCFTKASMTKMQFKQNTSAK